MLETIFTHRSIRKYKSTPIDPAIMDKILEAGTRASTTGNMQVYSMIMTTDPGLRRQLWEAHFRQDMVLQAPVLITFCADFHRFNTWCLQRKAMPGYDNFLSFFTAAIDALLVSQNVALAAESYGLGICYLGTVTYMADQIIRILGLPEHVVPVAAMVVGVPDESPSLTDRLPLEAVVHHERYQPYDAASIDRLYHEKESMPLTRKLLEENGKETLAQVFTDKRYPREDNVSFSNRLLKVIHDQGFMNQ
jgi:FMN reductase (NADPH)